MVLGTTEIIIIALVVVAVLFFGGKKLQELAKGAGRAVGEFKKSKREVELELEDVGKKRRKK